MGTDLFLLLGAALVLVAIAAQYRHVNLVLKRKGYDENMGCLSMWFMGWPDSLFFADLLPDQRKRRYMEELELAAQRSAQSKKERELIEREQVEAEAAAKTREQEFKAKEEEFAARERALEERERKLEQREERQ